MPPKKGTYTPNKPLDNPTWTLDEGEQMCRYINDLQMNIVIKYELQDMEAKLEAKMDGLKEEIMNVLKNFIIEKTPKSEKTSHEIHDEDTRKVNQEWSKLSAEDSTWEDDSFIQKHPELLKHCRQHFSQGEGYVKTQIVAH